MLLLLLLLMLQAKSAERFRSGGVCSARVQLFFPDGLAGLFSSYVRRVEIVKSF